MVKSDFQKSFFLPASKIKIRSDDTIEYVFFEDFCAQENDEDILKVASEAGENFNFQIQSFSFSGPDVMDDDVFLHCDVSVKYFRGNSV